MSSGPPLVSLHDVSKRFGPHRVLEAVCLDVRAGEVHALAGENGAGKSTLMKILAGVYPDYDGEIRLQGHAVRFAGPATARDAGVATIYQELSLVGPMSVADNLVLGREPVGHLGAVSRRRRDGEAARVLGELGLALDLDTPVEDLPLSVRQLVEIAKALAARAHVLVMDEPTSALGEQAAEALFDRIRRLRGQGCGIVFITHRLEEIYALADRITILRDGRVVGAATPGELPRERLVSWMARAEEAAADVAVSPVPAATKARLEVHALSVRRPQHPGSFEVRDLSFSVGRGEIVGLAGLQGSGTTQVLRALFGRERAEGRVRLNGDPFPLVSPRRSLAAGIALVPGDRAAEGVIPDLTVVENATLAALRSYSRGGWLAPRLERRVAGELGKKLRLRTPSLDAPMRALSGGNQQKVLLGRFLLIAPQVLLLDDPTRGVDVSAKADIHGLLRAFAAEGGAIVLVSSELEEMQALCHRILVLHRGILAASLTAAEATRERILAAAFGQVKAS